MWVLWIRILIPTLGGETLFSPSHLSDAFLAGSQHRLVPWAHGLAPEELSNFHDSSCPASIHHPRNLRQSRLIDSATMPPDLCWEHFKQDALTYKWSVAALTGFEPSELSTGSEGRLAAL